MYDQETDDRDRDSRTTETTDELWKAGAAVPQPPPFLDYGLDI